MTAFIESLPEGAALRQDRTMSLVEAIPDVTVGYGVAGVTQVLIDPHPLAADDAGGEPETGALVTSCRMSHALSPAIPRCIREGVAPVHPSFGKTTGPALRPACFINPEKGRYS